MVKYETGTIKFKKFDKQIRIPFKVYAETECFIKRVNINKVGCTKLYQKHVPNSIGAKLLSIDDRFTLATKIFTGSSCGKEFPQWVFEQQKYCNKIINEHFNKKLKMSTENEENYQNLQNCMFLSCHVHVSE